MERAAQQARRTTMSRKSSSQTTTDRQQPRRCSNTLPASIAAYCNRQPTSLLCFHQHAAAAKQNQNNLPSKAAHAVLQVVYHYVRGYPSNSSASRHCRPSQQNALPRRTAAAHNNKNCCGSNQADHVLSCSQWAQPLRLRASSLQQQAPCICENNAAPAMHNTPKLDQHQSLD
jgi:hypothetical protein